MERKFESELGERVVEKNGHKLGKKTAALVGAMAICTLMISCAFSSLAENQPAKDSGVMFDDHVDYIYGADGEVDVKRTMTLKNKTMTANGDSELTYTSFNYTVSLSVNDADLSLEGAIIGSLEIVIDGADDSNVYIGNYDGYFELMGPDLNILSVPVAGIVECGEFPGLVEFPVPSSFSEVVTAGSKLSLNVTLTFDVGFLSGEVTESWDPEIEATALPCLVHTEAFDPVESYPGPRWLF